ncbi:MAG: ABC transporter ATP-binding protein [bacterium]
MSVLKLGNLRKEYRLGWPGKKTLVAVDDLNISVEQGEIYGFLGPNGAGKTTTLKMIMEFTRPTAGDVLVFGESAGNWKIRERIGFLPDNPVLYPFLSGYMALYIVGKMFSLTHREIKKRIGRLADELGLDRELKLTIGKHSRGMRQRIGLAQALINDPDLLIMDEPMSGLDPKGRKMFREVLQRRREAGKTVFFSSRILSDIEMICGRVGIINYGRMIYEDSMENVSARADGKRLEEVFMEKVEGSE